ncbi:MAG TPA: chitobiase/beta-hexosaminidase C-terminal domain-containing protein, partial [Dongiaceae bacterium]|nr:chitobiase/beta-hexosaminidase C-terminal domain-containing protein [Dongiaceae bacterium]
LVVIGSAHTGWAASLQISAGGSHTAVLRSDGTIWTTGSNAAGQLGDGSGSSLRTSPVQVGLPGNAVNWKATATGANHTLGLKADGSLWAWGSNQYGQLGDGKNADKRSPVRIGSANSWTAIAAGGSSSFALKADGTLWAWGRNNLGQLGNADQAAIPVDRNAPVQVVNSGSSPFVVIVAGDEHAIALQADGSLWAWGANRYGNVPLQVMDQNNQITQRPADSSPHSTPVRIDFDNDWSVIAAGGSHSLAIKSNGTLWTWGRCNAGQLGIGVTDNSAHAVPVQVGTDRDWTSLSAGGLHSLAAKRNGTLWAWGDNSNGQLGDDTVTGHNSPIRITGPLDIPDIVVVAAGGHHTFAARANGEIYSWGSNTSGQLGDGTTTGNLAPLQVDSDAVSWIDTELGGQFTLARRSDGTLWAWGDNSSGQLGDGSFAKRPVPTMVGTAVNWVKQASGWNHTLALRADGSLWAWGDNTSGQLGSGTTSSGSTPVHIGAGQDWSAVAAGDMHSLALKRDGTLWAWGDNTNGQLGDGTTINSLTPRQVVTNIPGNFDSHWAAISAGGSHTLALQSDGTLWVWGDNSSGQLGDTSLGAGVNAPRQIVYFNTPGFNSGWVAISAGMSHSLALQADGTLWAWGNNVNSQLGNGNSIDQGAPVQVLSQGAAPFVAIAAGDSFSVARLADGSLWSWGSNSSGQLGKVSASSASPVRESTNAIDWVGVGAGGSHAVALKAGGGLWSWGNNAAGQLGDGTTIDRNTPAPLAEAHIDVDTSAIDYKTVAIGAVSSRNITIGNKGTASLTISSLSIGGQDSAMFGIYAGGTCGNASFTLAPGGSCTAALAFKAGSPGGLKNATLSIASNDPVSPAVTVDLFGTAGVQHTLTASVSSASPAGSGTISPSGTVLVLDGTSQTFSITPGAGYHVSDVTVDGISQGAMTSLTLPLVKANASVTALFAINTPPTSKATPGAGNYAGDVIVALTMNRAGVIYYTTDGTTPTTSSPVYSGPIALKSPSTTTVRFFSMDKAGYSEAVQSLTYNLHTPDLSGSVEINNGAVFTNSQQVNLALNASDPAGVTEMQVACDGTTYAQVEPYAVTRSCTLSPGDGLKTVLVKFKDGLGNWYPPLTAQITLNTTVPTTAGVSSCDLNGDGKVDISDALKALQITIGLYSPTLDEMIRGDVAPLVNGKPRPDGKIDIADTLLILQRSLGLVAW